MRFAIFSLLTGARWEAVRDLWVHADRAGWDTACLTDHFMPNTADREGETLECWTTLASLAPLTARMRIGTIVSGNTYRHPAVLAKMAANIDVVSGGRLVCGIGAGWQANEHQAYGIPFHTVGERLRMLDEACEVMKRLWTDERASFEGRHYRLDGAPLQPKPVQKPYPELMVGGGGEKVTLRIAARHADHWNAWGGPEVHRRKGRILDEHCAAVGRDPAAILRSAVMVPLLGDDPAEIERVVPLVMRRLGRSEAEAHDLLLAGSPGRIADTLGRLAETGVGLVFLPTSYMPADPRPFLDRFQDQVIARSG